MKNLIERWKKINSLNFLTVTIGDHFSFEIPNESKLFRISAFLHPFFKKFNSIKGLVFNTLLLIFSYFFGFSVYRVVLIIIMTILLLSMINFIDFQITINKWLKRYEDGSSGDDEEDEPIDPPEDPPSIMKKFLEEKEPTPVL